MKYSLHKKQFVYSICVFVYLYICVFVYLYTDTTLCLVSNTATDDISFLHTHAHARRARWMRRRLIVIAAFSVS